jgi:hypothetical protein
MNTCSSATIGRAGEEPRCTIARVNRLAALAIVALGAACQSAPPPRPAPAMPVQAPSAATVSDAVAPDAATADPFASVRARGALHGDPIKLPAAGKFPDRWLVFVGSSDVARAGWLFTPGVDQLAPVDGWPVGTKVIGSVVRDSVAYLLLETVKMFDQPAGLRAVWFEGFGTPSPFTALAQRAFDGVHDLDELERRIEAGPPPAKKSPPDGALVATLRAASKSEAGLASALASSGADVVDVWQEAFRQTVETLDPTKVSASPRASKLVDFMRQAIKDDDCDGVVCETTTANGHATIQFVEEGARWKIREIAIDVVPPPPTLAGAPHAVDPSTATDATDHALREHVSTVKTILGEAPLGASGTIGVALTDYEAKGPAIVIADGDYSRVFPLGSMDLVASAAPDASFEVRFADLDADGRTDVVIRGSGATADGTSVELSEAFLAPVASVEIDEDGLAADHGSELALLGAMTVDSALQAALGVAPRGVARDDACKLMAGASQLAAFRKITTADVRILGFEEPLTPTYRPHVVAASHIGPNDVRDVARRCAALDCSATRPFCSYSDGPYSEFYWFTWEQNAMRLAGVAFYKGS